MKIAFIGDQFGKVHYNRFVSMSKHMDVSFDFFTVKDKSLSRASGKYDALYYASYTMFKRKPLTHPRVFGSATSWKCIFGNDHVEDMKLLNKFHRISVNNLSLFKEIIKYRNDVVYIPNGVESDFFTPLDHDVHDPLRVGWVGNKDRGEKNFRILQKVKKRCPGIHWKIIATSKSSDVSKLRNRKQMRDFYRTLDYLLVTSSYEGTPNPALEAASCGVPIVSTPVGNMTELIKDGITGFFVKPVSKCIVELLNKLPSEKYPDMSHSIRDQIVSKWKWSLIAKKFDVFFG